MVRYKPYEEQQLESLIPALNQGMDPTTAYSIFSGIQGSAVERAAQQKAQRQAMLAEAMAQMQQAAAGGVDQQGLESLMGSYQATFPGLNRPRMDARLEGTLESLIPQGMNQSPLFTQAPMDPASIPPNQMPTLDDETAQGVYNDAVAAASGDPEAGRPPMPLHDARMLIVGRLRAAGYTETAIQQAYDAVGRAYQAAAPGKLIDAPLRMGGKSPLEQSLARIKGGSAQVGMGWS
jgi:hypothetical protein